MDEKRYCGACIYLVLDTAHMPRRNECDRHHRRVIGNEVPKWCKVYTPITAEALMPVKHLDKMVG